MSNTENNLHDFCEDLRTVLQLTRSDDARYMCSLDPELKYTATSVARMEGQSDLNQKRVGKVYKHKAIPTAAWYNVTRSNMKDANWKMEEQLHNLIWTELLTRTSISHWVKLLQLLKCTKLDLSSGVKIANSTADVKDIEVIPWCSKSVINMMDKVQSQHDVTMADISRRLGRDRSYVLSSIGDTSVIPVEIVAAYLPYLSDEDKLVLLSRALNRHATGKAFATYVPILACIGIDALRVNQFALMENNL